MRRDRVKIVVTYEFVLKGIGMEDADDWLDSALSFDRQDWKHILKNGAIKIEPYSRKKRLMAEAEISK